MASKIKMIDVHAHLGEDVVFDENLTEKELIDAYKEYDIYGGIVQPYLPQFIWIHIKKFMIESMNLLKQKKKSFGEWLR